MHWKKTAEFQRARATARASMLGIALDEMAGMVLPGHRIAWTIAQGTGPDVVRLAAIRLIAVDLKALSEVEASLKQFADHEARLVELEKGGTDDADAAIPGRTDSPS